MCRECIPARYREIRYCGCGCGFRQFLTPEEEIERLENYKKQLRKEIEGVEKRVKELKE